MNHSSGSQIGIDKIIVPPRPSMYLYAFFKPVDIERRLYNVHHCECVPVYLYFATDTLPARVGGKNVLNIFFSDTYEKLQPRNYIKIF